MGYLVEWHIPRRKFNFDILNRLPAGLAVYVFRVDECEFDLIYTDFAARKYFPQKFDEKYDKLNSLYEALVDTGLQVSLDLQVVNLNLWLSQALQDEVISIISSDDQLDLAVQSKAGSLSRLRFAAEEIEVLYEDDDVQIIPFFLELCEPDVDLQEFVNRDFVVHPREKVMPCELHGIAADEIASFLGIKPQVIGLATGHFDEECLRRVFTRKIAVGSATREETGKEVLSKNKNLSLKTRFILIMSSVFAVTGIRGFSEYKDSGHLDQSWYIATGATIALVLIVFGVLAGRRKIDKD